jgi:oligoribonuclease
MLLWIDLETTGLTPRHDYILEIAWSITDNGGSGDDRVESHVVRPTPAIWHMIPQTPFVYEMHEASGLLADLEQPTGLATLEDIETALLKDMDYYGDDEPWMLAGFSVHFDKGFIEEHMPRLFERISHRIFDVSTLRTFFRPFGFVSEHENLAKHRAAHDVMESMSVARGYMNQLNNLVKA